jgi:DNA-binding transcriptional ArsR family regulator
MLWIIYKLNVGRTLVFPLLAGSDVSVLRLKRAGLVAERPEGRNVHYRAEPRGPGTAGRLDEPLWRLLARALRRLLILLKEIDP